ncbi:MAG: hypothetical protein WBE76_11480 [Terracidiphilus sp.]
MAPEAPGNLVVIDSRFQDGELAGYVERVDYSPDKMGEIEAAGRWFWVLWNEQPKGPEYRPLGGGAVYVNEGELPSGYEFAAKSPILLDSLGNGTYAMRDVAQGAGIMLVLILPEGYTFADPAPMPKSAKIVKKRRLATYWKPLGSYGTGVRISWQLRRFDGDLRAERDRINADIHRSSDVPDNPGVFIGKPPAKENTAPNSRNPWISGSFYLAAFAIVLAILLAAARTIPLWALPIVIAGALCAVSVIGALQLKQDRGISDKSFLALMGLAFKQVPFLARMSRKERD